MELADNLGLGDIFAAVGLMSSYLMTKKVLVLLTFLSCLVGAVTNALERFTKFVGAGLIPYGMEFGMIAELAIFKGLAGFFVEYRKGLFGEKSIIVRESGGRLGSD